MYHNKGGEQLVAQLRNVQTMTDSISCLTQYCIVSGSTGCGKSVLINLLMDIPLAFEKTKAKTYEFKQEGGIEGPLIKNTASNYSQDIGVYRYKDNTFIDMPSQKNDGQVRVNLEKVVKQSVLYKNGKQIKYIFMTDIFEVIASRSVEFIDNIRHVLTRFDLKTLQEVCKSSLLVVSKFGAYSQIREKQEVIECIEEIAQIQSNPKNKIVTSFLKYLIQANQIYLFPVPDHPLFQTSINLIKQNLSVLPYVHLQYYFPSYANQEGQLFLRKEINRFLEQIKQVCAKSVDKMKMNFKPMQNQSDLNNIEILKQAEYLLQDPEELDFENREVKKLFVSLGLQKQAEKLIDMIDKIDYLEKFIKKDQSYVSYEDCFMEISFAIKSLREHLQNSLKGKEQIQELNERYLKEQQKGQLQIKSYMQKYETLREKEKQNRMQRQTQLQQQRIQYSPSPQMIPNLYQPNYYQPQMQPCIPFIDEFMRQAPGILEEVINSVQSFLSGNISRKERRRKNKQVFRENNADLVYMRNNRTTDPQRLEMEIAYLENLKKSEFRALQKKKNRWW